MRDTDALPHLSMFEVLSEPDWSCWLDWLYNTFMWLKWLDQLIARCVLKHQILFWLPYYSKTSTQHVLDPHHHLFNLIVCCFLTSMAFLISGSIWLIWWWISDQLPEWVLKFVTSLVILCLYVFTTWFHFINWG